MKNVCKKAAALIFWIAVGAAFIGLFEYLVCLAIVKQEEQRDKERLERMKTAIHQEGIP